MLLLPCHESSMPHHPTPTKQDPKDTPESGRALKLLLLPDTGAVAVRKVVLGGAAGRTQRQSATTRSPSRAPCRARVFLYISLVSV